jgi:hypothetical protein
MAQGEWKVTQHFIEQALAILEAEHPMTVRQLFYRLVSAGTIANNRGEYQRVSRLMTKARRDDRCPFRWLVDRSRPTYQPNVFENPRGYAEAVKVSYRKDHWDLQSEYVEIWCEKDAVIGSIVDLTDELGVAVRVARGFLSATRVNDIAEHVNSVRKPKTVFYLGDHDPSGRSIEETAYRAVQWRAIELDRECECEGITLERLAIHPEDIAEFNLPPLRVKTKVDGDYADPRSEAFLSKFQDECVELDALPPTELRRRIQEAVQSRMDMVAWSRSVMVEQVELRNIVETVGSWIS